MNISEGRTAEVVLSAGAAVIDDLQPIDEDDIIRLIGYEIVKKEAK